MTMKQFILPIFLLLLVFSCREKLDDSIQGDYAPVSYELNLPQWMGIPKIPATNPLTIDGVELGRHLFFDPLLSGQKDVACASCHQPANAFSDGKTVSEGTQEIEGSRNTMQLVNLVFNDNRFFWDGAAASPEDAVEIHLEEAEIMSGQWDEVLERLRSDVDYPPMFRKAFGIELKTEMSKDLTVKAIAQFLRTLNSSDSRFDEVVYLNDGWFTDEQNRGRQLFFFEAALSVEHPGCSHCHFSPLFTGYDFYNNGIDSVATLDDFQDQGFGLITGIQSDNGKFKAPPLRNIEMTAPYMHDGRFATLEEVIRHYASGGHGVSNENINIKPFAISDAQIQDMVSFLKALTDTSFLKNPALTNPFE